MKDEIRFLIAEWFLGLAIKIVPKNNQGAMMCYYIKQYLEYVLIKKHQVK